MEKRESFLFEIRIDEQTADSRRAYENLYSGATLSQIPSFYLWYLKQLDLGRFPAPGRMLDVSCGAGEMVRLVGEAGWQAVGVDISENAARAGSQHVGPAGEIGVSTGEALPFSSGSFDIVTNIGSLEHLNDPALGAREMARVLKPNGRAYVLVPNTFSLLTNIWIAFRHGRTSVDDQPIQRYGARVDWTNLLEANGLQVLETRKYERPWPYYRPDWMYYLKQPKEFLRMLAGPLVPLNLAFCFVFVCRPSETQP